MSNFLESRDRFVNFHQLETSHVVAKNMGHYVSWQHFGIVPETQNSPFSVMGVYMSRMTHSSRLASEGRLESKFCQATPPES